VDSEKLLMSMKKLNILIAAALFFAAAAFLAVLKSHVDPQYSLDAAYYHVMTDQLENGKGFAEPVVWHHLKKYTEIERPMDYWMPLGIILFRFARTVFGYGNEIWINILLWSLLAALVFLETFRLTSCRLSALTAAISLILCGRFVFYILTTDNFVFYAFLGFLYFNLLKPEAETSLLLPFVAGLTSLMRIEGLIFAAFAGFIGFAGKRSLARVVVFAAIFFITISPWIYRNIVTFGVVWNSNSSALFLTKYDDFFTGDFNGTLAGFLEQGLSEILRQRFYGLGNSILNLIAVPGQFVFFPFWLVGIALCWKSAGRPFAWVLTAFVLLCGLLFTHQSARGTALHISAFFVAHFSIFLGVGFYQIRIKYLPVRKSYLLLLFVIVWSAAFTWLSLNTLIRQYDYDLAPYKAIFKSYLPQNTGRFVSVSPVFVKNLSGAGGVISIATDTERILSTADFFNCDHILLDTRTGQKPIIEMHEWVQIASMSQLILYQRNLALSAQ